jgi:MoaA/NifB/PqqE/SkfB family radical SAM enzyme
MCGFGKTDNPFNKDKFMPIDKYKTILSQIGNQTTAIRLNGRGESTIHPHFVEMLEYTKQQFPQVDINLFSNFSFNNNKVISALAKNKVQLFISMDSPIDKELKAIRTGANFSFINRNIKTLKDFLNRPFIIFTIQEKNINRITDIAKYAFENNCHIIYNTIRMDTGIETFISAVKNNYYTIIEQFEAVDELYKNSNLQCLYPDQLAGVELKNPKTTQTHGTMQNCPALNNELCILYDGTVTPCNMFNPYIYGNIFKQSLNEIWNDKKRNDFLKSYKDYYYCKNCANLTI